ncbi:MAG TPA: WYL domain-containing protein [Acidimicrobiales bacterium]
MPRLSANGRLQRLLSLVPWVAAHDGPTVDEVCRRFGLTREQLLADLDVVFLCGLYPYTPDELVEVVVEEDRVWIRYAEFFARPLRLTPEQALALVAAGASLLAAPGADPEGPLARGLAKLAAVLGVAPDEALEVSLGTAAEETLELLQEAVRASRQVELDYYAFGRDERARRVVDPYRVYADQGQWYVAGWDHLRDGERVFRVDRISSATLLASTFDPPADQPDLGAYRPRPEDPRVVLDLAPGARWVVEQYPLERFEEREGGGCRVTLAVSAVPWLERLLLRLGPDATVVDWDGGGPRDLAGDAACRVLARYRGGDA